MTGLEDVTADVASETIAAVVGDLEHARKAITGWTPEGRAAVADMVSALAGELADLARALHARP